MEGRGRGRGVVQGGPFVVLFCLWYGEDSWWRGGGGGGVRELCGGGLL